MAITFDVTTRKSISRRIVKIPVENTAFGQAITNMNDAAATFLAVDDGNRAFYENYSNLTDRYENEIALKLGVQCGTILEADIQSGGQQAAGNMFFPTVPPYNMYSIPMIVPEVNGNNTTHPVIPFERGTINNPPLGADNTGNGIDQIVDILQNGFNFGGAATNTTAPYVPGAGVLIVAATVGFVAGQYIVVAGGGTSAVFLITAIVGLSLNVFEICAPDIALPGASGVGEVLAGFTQAERQTLVATVPAFQNILNSLTTVGANSLTTLILTVWDGLLTDQLTQLAANDDPRVVPVVNNAAEIGDCNNAQIAIATWGLLPDVGVGGRYDDVPLAAILALTAARDARITVRITIVDPNDTATWGGQIITALGGVVDNGDGTFAAAAGDTTCVYYQRYFFINVRISRAFGTYSKSYRATQGEGTIQTILDNNTACLAQYQIAMIASKFVSNGDETIQLEIEDSTGFNLGDNIYIISEDVAEVLAVIQNVSGNILTLNIAVPITYTTRELARALRIL